MLMIYVLQMYMIVLGYAMDLVLQQQQMVLAVTQVISTVLVLVKDLYLVQIMMELEMIVVEFVEVMLRH